jgi:ABC-type cobalamin/Fe3+-siderophores transport system ATPase subunit
VEWVASFADRVIALHAGTVLLEGTPQEVLTSDLLLEKGFGISRYTSAARKARELGLWSKDTLPVTLEQAVEGFSPLSLHGRGMPEGQGEGS